MRRAGLAGLDGVRPPGRPRRVDRAKVIAATLTPPPQESGGDALVEPAAGRTGWASSTPRSAAIWKEYGVKPWKAETFKFSTDPELEAKVTDVVGLYLAPPENAIVLCVDEKSQMQALNRTQKTLPMQPGHAEQRTHDYVRHGTTTLFAALEIATGKVTGLCKSGTGTRSSWRSSSTWPAPTPTGELHLVMDNYAAHKRVEVRDWLAANPRIHVHFTPTSGSWLNLVEVWFGIIERQAIRRGSFPSVRDLMIKIRAFITAGTSASTRSSGPNPPTRSSTRSTANVNMSQRRATRRVRPQWLSTSLDQGPAIYFVSPLHL